ncbi:MAG: DNA repair protein RecO [Planctomycetota bacterium]
MKRRRAPAIVLRRWPYSETSLVLRALTPASGTVSLFARGVHRMKSGQLGVLDTWALIHAEYGEGEHSDLHPLYRSSLEHRFSGISENPDRIVAAAVRAELAELAAPPGSPSEPAFLYLLEGLQELDRPLALLPFLCRTLVAGLGLLGLTPRLEMEEVLASAASPPSRAGLGFSPSTGGIGPLDGLPHEKPAHPLLPATLDLLRNLRDHPGRRIEADSACLQAAFTILEEFLLYHLEHQPRALAALRRRHPDLATLA